MEKQEAIDFILAEIEKGRSTEEIASELSQKLGAPKEMVASFVSRTLASQVEVGQKPPQPTESEPVEEIPSTPEEESDTTADAGAIQEEENQDSTGLTSAGEELNGEGEITEEPGPMEEILLVEQTEWVEESYTYEEATPAIQDQPAADTLTAGEIPPEGAKQLVAVTSPEDTNATPAPVWDPDALAKKSAEPLSPGDRARLEKAILSALSRGRRQSDVVMMVCERTGMSWDQAQRLVAEVSTKNRAKINQREGTIQILLSLLALVAGLALIFLVMSEAYTFYRLYAQPETVSPVIPVLDRYTIWGGMVGVLLFLGGITGVVLGIRKRQD